MSTTIPNFFMVGAPKSGTTALSHYLSHNPNIFITNLKEPEYFAADFRGRCVKLLKSYLNLFSEAEKRNYVAIGECSTIYLHSEVAIENIMKFNREAKILVMLRNPADLVISLHAQLLKEGYETEDSFINAWTLEQERLFGRRLPFLFGRDPKQLFYSDWGKLGTQLRRCMDIVPASQLRVIIFDDFVSNPRKIYQDVLSFLDVPDDGRIDFPIINVSRIPRKKNAARVLRLFFLLWLPIRIQLFKGKGIGFGQYIQNKFEFPQNSEDTSIKKYKKMLRRYFSNEISILENLLNRDLENWK